VARVVATISGHGFGHLSISAPVLNQLGRTCPGLELTVLSGLSRERISTRVQVPFVHGHTDWDFGVSNLPDLSVAIGDTADRYRQIHANWTSSVQDCADRLEALGCDLLFSNVSYLSLFVAHRLGVPSIALSPLNWADIYLYFLSGTPGFDRIHDQMARAYASAGVFLVPTPSMPMDPRLATRRIGPVAEIGRDRKSEIQRMLGVDPSCRLILVAMGGHALRLTASWPARDDMIWLIPRNWMTDHQNTAPIEDLEVPFLDLLASSDLLITKPGYGSFTEAACAGKPVLYVLRPDWPEERYLIDWLNKHCRCRPLDPARLRSGRFVDDVISLLDSPQAARPPKPTGTADAVAAISRLLARP